MVLAVATGVVFATVAGGVFPFDEASEGLKLGVLVALVAPLGDLSESLVKRDLGVKDMGSVLPGHGGLLDRFDALLFVLPAVWYLGRVSDFFLT
jgi:phosphatidate cytidylyltransferase